MGGITRFGKHALKYEPYTQLILMEFDLLGQVALSLPWIIEILLYVNINKFSDSNNEKH